MYSDIFFGSSRLEEILFIKLVQDVGELLRHHELWHTSLGNSEKCSIEPELLVATRMKAVPDTIANHTEIFES